MDRFVQEDQSLSPISGIEKANDDSPLADGSLVAALSVIWRVIRGRRYAVPEADIPDVGQEVALRVWKWREKYPNKSEGMTVAEWHSFAAKTTHNEINRFSSGRTKNREVPIDDAYGLSAQAPNGDTHAEMVSLVGIVWQEIWTLSLYQRRALLLGSIDLIIYLVQFGIAEVEIAASLEIRQDDWAELSGRVPLSDREIAAIARSSKSISDPEAATRAIGKARFDARKKLGRLRK